MAGRLAGKVALISGAARGQGAAEARRFVEDGAGVAGTDVREPGGPALAADLGEAALFHRLDGIGGAGDGRDPRATRR